MAWISETTPVPVLFMATDGGSMSAASNKLIGSIWTQTDAEPRPTSAIVALPCNEMFAKSTSVMLAVVKSAKPFSPSLTTRYTVNRPTDAYACCGRTPDPVVPSPNSQEYVRG